DERRRRIDAARAAGTGGGRPDACSSGRGGRDLREEDRQGRDAYRLEALGGGSAQPHTRPVPISGRVVRNACRRQAGTDQDLAFDAWCGQRTARHDSGRSAYDRLRGRRRAPRRTAARRRQDASRRRFPAWCEDGKGNGDLMSMLSIRVATPRDREAIRRVEERAFGQPAEAGLVDALVAAGDAVVELVAEDEGEIVGHILFSRIRVKNGKEEFQAVALAPL